MFDSHAHIGETTASALVCTACAYEYDKLSGFRYKAAGSLPGYGKPDLDAIMKAASEGLCIGEIGLDRRYGCRDEQIATLRDILSIAADCDAFTIFHIIRDYEMALRLIDEYGIKRFMVHSFSSSYEMAREIIKRGGIISLSPKAERLRSFQRILTLPFVTETDMKTGKEELETLEIWNQKLSILAFADVGRRSEEMMMEVLR